jgi:hypothetical protein
MVCVAAVLYLSASKVLGDDPFLNFVTHERYSKKRCDDHDTLRPPHEQGGCSAVGQRLLEGGENAQFRGVAALHFGLDDVKWGGDVRRRSAADKAR